MAVMAVVAIGTLVIGGGGAMPMATEAAAASAAAFAAAVMTIAAPSVGRDILSRFSDLMAQGREHRWRC